ncbi:uncharacterized protein N7446_004924 [Penicillium canescens]|uniref:uncharacterized protein n=1 Tax=Penicillium canescens TaxID=5083 RepID=UPI0026DF1039|nr:uncharacterized protein N7446_004924 [Penicillium canescens]KAJ6067887.1 hypothetical protein N7446_004924 [Penicillium canescens]
MVQLAPSTTDVSKSGERAVAENPTGVHSPTIFETLIKDRNIHELGLEFSLREIQCNLGDKLHPILQGISGRIMKGRLFGILGPSGAGKSTLINILAGRSKPTYGSISINEVSGDPTNVIGLVPQDDIALEDLTVKENVLHAARIRLGGLWDDAKIGLHVDQILDYLGLTHVMDQRVGSIEKRGISGGERKRVSIALGIVAMPMAVILDEPTSGLDATTALSIMNLLKSLSTLGITVICAIHQPRRDIYQLLDDIIVLNLGKQIYLGETSTAHKHFETLGSLRIIIKEVRLIVYQCPRETE